MLNIQYRIKSRVKPSSLQDEGVQSKLNYYIVLIVSFIFSNMDCVTEELVCFRRFK